MRCRFCCGRYWYTQRIYSLHQLALESMAKEAMLKAEEEASSQAG